MYRNNSPYHSFKHGFPGQMMYPYPAHFQRALPAHLRNQPYSHYIGPQNHEWHPMHHQGPYYPVPYQHYSQNYPSSLDYSYQFQNQKDSQFLFHNPLQPQMEKVPKPYMPMNGYPVMNPYPKNSVIPKQPGGMQSIMNSFKSQDGSVDFNKLMNTAGQMMNAVNQMSSLVKGLGGMFKA